MKWRKGWRGEELRDAGHDEACPSRFGNDVDDCAQLLNVYRSGNGDAGNLRRSSESACRSLMTSVVANVRDRDPAL